MRTRATAAAMTASTAIQASLRVPGPRGQVHAARVFTGTTLGDDHPCAAVAVLLVSELVTNSVLHSDSRLPGGTVSVTPTRTPHHRPAVVFFLSSELVSNSVLHSDSRLPGGTVTVTVTGTPDVARVEVRDAGGISAPLLKGAHDARAEGGRGLRLVNDLAARWAYRRDGDGLVTWFEVRAEPPS